MRAMLLCFLLLYALPGSGEPVAALEDAVLQAREDVKASTAELNQLRNRIREERIPLSQQLDAKRNEVAALRAQVKQLRTARNSDQQERQQLTREVEQLEAEKEFVDTVLEEYRRSLETRISAAEVQYATSVLPENNLDLLPAAAVWMTRRTGGYSFPGKALDDRGGEVTGTFLILGPLGYFSNMEQSGWVIDRPGSVLPGFSPMADPQSADAVQKVLKGESSVLPVDVSGGDALKVREAKPNLMEQLRQGGVVVIPLLLLGAAAVFLSLKKAVSLSRMKARLGVRETELLRDLREEDVSRVLEEYARVSRPLGPLLIAAVKHRKASREHLEEILHEHVLAVLPRLESSLGALAVLGGVAPLLGLLGTVTGMIHTFMLVKIFGSGNTQTLSGGISEALVTTALGLILAIPILLVHAFLTRRAKVLLGELEQSGVAMVNLLKSDGDPGRDEGL